MTNLDEFMHLYKDSVAARQTDVQLDIRRDRSDITKGLKVMYDAATGRDVKAERIDSRNAE